MAPSSGPTISDYPLHREHKEKLWFALLLLFTSKDFFYIYIKEQEVYFSLFFIWEHLKFCKMSKPRLHMKYFILRSVICRYDMYFIIMAMYMLLQEETRKLQFTETF